MAITFTAGQEVTADDLNALVPVYINKASDETVTNSTAMQNDNDFVLSFGANQTWIVELYIEFQSVSATPDAQCDWAVTGGLTIPSRHCLGVPAASTDVTDTNVALMVRDDTSDVSTAVVTSTTSRASYREVLKVTTTTAGTATYRWAQNTANASGTILKANTSFLIAHRVS